MMNDIQSALMTLVQQNQVTPRRVEALLQAQIRARIPHVTLYVNNTRHMPFLYAKAACQYGVGKDGYVIIQIDLNFKEMASHQLLPLIVHEATHALQALTPQVQRVLLPARERKKAERLWQTLCETKYKADNLLKRELSGHTFLLFPGELIENVQYNVRIDSRIRDILSTIPDRYRRDSLTLWRQYCQNEIQAYQMQERAYLPLQKLLSTVRIVNQARFQYQTFEHLDGKLKAYQNSLDTGSFKPRPSWMEAIR